MDPVAYWLIESFLDGRQVSAPKVVKLGERDFVERLGRRRRGLMRLFPGRIENITSEYLEFLAADEPRMRIQHVFEQCCARAREAGQLRHADWLTEVFLCPPTA